MRSTLYGLCTTKSAIYVCLAVTGARERLVYKGWTMGTATRHRSQHGGGVSAVPAVS